LGIAFIGYFILSSQEGPTGGFFSVGIATE
jgi:hypothetical protein